MEEQKKQEMKNEAEENRGKKSILPAGFVAFMDRLPVRTCMLMCLAGLYLVYTGYTLCKNVINGTDGGHIGFFIAGVIFLVLAAGMLAIGIRGVLLDNKRQKEEEQPVAEAEESAEEEISEEK